MQIDDDIAQLAHAVVHRYIDALNDGNTEGVTDALNFPHFRIGVSGSILHYPDAKSDHLANFRNRTRADGWHRSVIDRLETIATFPTQAQVRMWFRRLRADDSEIGSFYSLYIITCQDGHWGIQGGAGSGI